MSGNTVYLNNINMNFSIMDVFQGKCCIYVSNPAFTPPGAPMFDEKKYFKIKPNKGPSTANSPTSYWTPSIHFMNSLKAYNANVNVCLTPNKETRPVFSFWKPFDLSNGIKTNMRLMTTFDDPAIVDKILLLDQRLNMILDILISSYLLGIDLKQFADMNNDDFFKAFNKVCSAAQTTSRPKLQNPATYNVNNINYWNEIYIHSKINDIAVAINPRDWNENLAEIEENPIPYNTKSLFSSLLKNFKMDGFTTSTGNFTPYNKRVATKNKDGEFVIRNNCSLRFKLKVGESKVPSVLISKMIKRKDRQVITTDLTDANFSQVWGGNSNKIQKYTGFVMVTINYDLNIYKMGSSFCAWQVSCYNGVPAKASSGLPTEDDMPDIPDDEPEDTIEDNEVRDNIGSIDLDDEDI